MKKTIINAVIICFVCFVGTCCVIAIDNICNETTGYGGKLVLDVEKLGVIH